MNVAKVNGAYTSLAINEGRCRENGREKEWKETANDPRKGAGKEENPWRSRG